jgi:formylglycine-generating enzyme required for sulfatase activity
MVPVLAQAAEAKAAEPRIALVIGNSAYPSGPLRNPANDAELMKDTLKRVGFDVIAKRDADQITMKRAIQEFGARLDAAGPKAVGLFYYAGHGVQLEGRNFLIPTTANIEREGDVEIEAVSADWVIEQMRYARNSLNIVILDACRNNPFTRSMRSAGHGLAVMDVPTGILIAYSAAAGAVAEDGNGRNSPYTIALTQAMLEQHEPLAEIFQDVRVAVMSATAQRQVPWEYSSLTGRFYFVAPEAAAAKGAPPLVAVAPAASAPPAPAATNTESPGFISSSMSRLANLFSSGSPGDSGPAAPKPPTTSNRPPNSGAGASVEAGPAIAGTRALALFKTLGIEAQDIDAAHAVSQLTIRRIIESAPRRVRLGSTPEQIQAAFALCKRYAADCKLSWYDEGEGVRAATLLPFQLDEFPVSVRAYRQFADSSHYLTHAERVGYAYALKPDGSGVEQVDGGNWRNALKRHPADDDAPVVGVTFLDAVAYCKSNGARVPSEDEWEYVARGPARSVFPWGDDPTPVARAMRIAPHVMDGPGEGIGGRYKGLSGSVWQWVDTSLYARCDPNDPGKLSACKVLKGGSWLESNPANKRAATRRYEHANTADEDSGFRCARSASVWPDADVWLSQLR